MPNQCIHCGKIYPDMSEVLLKGCECGSHFFFFIRKEQLQQLKENKVEVILEGADKKRIERDVREIIGIESEEAPVILDLESVRVVEPGKFEIDIVNLFSKRRPLIYKLEEGKYIIDLASTFQVDLSKYKRIEE